ncbi:L,D-transpeptidase family protein [Saccharophagus degradans]|uniref:L,D-transpeptidase family protein n=1 Tax=Saccharophagus degradans TaxID=86304 RepID=UPI0020901C63|nr:hypothetical protein [Saccharophagus degradans]
MEKQYSLIGGSFMVRSGLIAGLLLLFSCAIAANNQLPTSARSVAAINKVEPVLIQALGEKSLRYGAPIFIRIFKRSATLEVWLQAESGRFELFKVYDICAQSGRLGPKLRRGDRQAPEGFYFVNAQRFNPWSKFHLSFNLGYPNAYDRAHGRTVARSHGQCFDGTWGLCIYRLLCHDRQRNRRNLRASAKSTGRRAAIFSGTYISLSPE